MKCNLYWLSKAVATPNLSGFKNLTGLKRKPPINYTKLFG